MMSDYITVTDHYILHPSGRTSRIRKFKDLVLEVDDDVPVVWFNPGAVSLEQNIEVATTALALLYPELAGHF